MLDYIRSSYVVSFSIGCNKNIKFWTTFVSPCCICFLLTSLTVHIFRCQQINLCSRALWCWAIFGSWCCLSWPKGCCDNFWSHRSRSVPLMFDVIYVNINTNSRQVILFPFVICFSSFELKWSWPSHLILVFFLCLVLIPNLMCTESWILIWL